MSTVAWYEGWSYNRLHLDSVRELPGWEEQTSKASCRKTPLWACPESVAYLWMPDLLLKETRVHPSLLGSQRSGCGDGWIETRWGWEWRTPAATGGWWGCRLNCRSCSCCCCSRMSSGPAARTERRPWPPPPPAPPSPQARGPCNSWRAWSRPSQILRRRHKVWVQSSLKVM